MLPMRVRSSLTSRSEGRVSVRPSPAMPSSTARPPGRQSWVARVTATGAPAVSTTRSSSAAGGGGLGGGAGAGGGGGAAAREDDVGGPQPARELELLLAHAEGDDPRRRVQAQQGDGQVPEAPPAHPAGRLTGLGACLLEAAQDDRRRLDEHAGIEGDVLGQ